jgi:putative phosphotransacetylase
MRMNVSIGVSNRHVHLTQETYDKLFDEPMTKKKDLSQPGNFASNQTVTIKTEKAEINNVRIVGPCRNYNQIELAKSDARRLGIDPPVRNSGEVEDAAVVTVITDKGSIDLPNAIISRRHVHMHTSMANELGITNYDTVKIIKEGDRGGVLYGVVRVSDRATLECHIDTDEASAFGINQGDILTMEIDK